MNTSEQTLTNGTAGAAFLGAGIGSIVLGLLTILGDAIGPLKSLLNFYAPTGPLSGVTTVSVIIWLIVWAFLYFKWKNSEVNLCRIFTISLVLIGAGLVLMFPPFIDIFA